MLRMLLQAGPTAPPLLLLAVVIIGLTIYRLIQVVQTGATKGPRLRAGINTIFFWEALRPSWGYLDNSRGSPSPSKPLPISESSTRGSCTWDSTSRSSRRY